MNMKQGRFLLCIAGLFIIYAEVRGLCLRDEALAKEQDPTRICRKPCVVDADCDSEKKTCVCDDVCGMSCFNPDATCPDIRGTLENGVVSLRDDDMTYDAVARHWCNDGYFMTGVSKRKCRSTRQWSHTAPNCTRGCDPPGHRGNGFVVSDQAGYSPGATVQYTCKTGYKYAGGSLTITCQDDFTWSGATFQCVKKDCGSPGDLEHGKVIGTSFVFGSSIKLECDKGYLLHGHKEMRCNAEPVWLPDSLPTCEPVSCPAPVTPENGEVDEKYSRGRTYGGEVDYSCFVGFKLDGPQRGRCNENATWGEVPVCAYDGDCAFTSRPPKTCGYSIVDGSFDTKLDMDGPGGLPTYILYKQGTLRSASIPVAENSDGVCFKFEYKASRPDSLFGEVALGGGEFQTVWKAESSSSWTEGEVAVRRPAGDAAEFQAQWQLRATSSVDIANIKMRPLSECALLGIPAPTSTTLTRGRTFTYTVAPSRVPPTLTTTTTVAPTPPTTTTVAPTPPTTTAVALTPSTTVAVATRTARTVLRSWPYRSFTTTVQTRKATGTVARNMPSETQQEKYRQPDIFENWMERLRQKAGRMQEEKDRSRASSTTATNPSWTTLPSKHVFDQNVRSAPTPTPVATKTETTTDGATRIRFHGVFIITIAMNIFFSVV